MTLMFQVYISAFNKHLHIAKGELISILLNFKDDGQGEFILKDIISQDIHATEELDKDW